jgi:hypothetical protein
LEKRTSPEAPRKKTSNRSSLQLERYHDPYIIEEYRAKAGEDNNSAKGATRRFLEDDVAGSQEGPDANVVGRRKEMRYTALPKTFTTKVAVSSLWRKDMTVSH